MKTTPLTDDFGVEVSDIDLREPISDDQARELHRLFSENHLLVVRGQDLDEHQQVDFAGTVGTPRKNRDGTSHAWISNAREDGLAGGARLLFHSDAAFKSTPVAGISLYGVELDDESSPTVFASSVDAWDRLDDDLRATVADLEVEHVIDLHSDDFHRTRSSEIDWETADSARYRRATHPLGLYDAASDRTCLFVNEQQSSHVIGMEEKASDELFARLFEVLYDESRMYTHQWQIGDLIVWNNVALQHGRPAQQRNASARTLRRVVLTETFAADQQRAS